MSVTSRFMARMGMGASISLPRLHASSQGREQILPSTEGMGFTAVISSHAFSNSPSATILT
jgi:hypothetical protein